MLNKRNMVLAVLALVLLVGVAYMMDNTLFGLLGRKEGFGNGNAVVETTGPMSMTGEPAGALLNPGAADAGAVNGAENVIGGNDSNNNDVTEGFESLNPAPMPFPSAQKPANCYPKNQLAPQELLPGDPNTKWAQVNPQSSGDIAGKNFLNAGALIGVNTVGQSLRNASWDLRSEVPNPQVQVSPWMQSTISPDLARRPLEIA